MHGFLEDFRSLARDIASRPTCIAELIPDPIPATLGAYDAAGMSIGGIHFIPDVSGSVVPVLWRQKKSGMGSTQFGFLGQSCWVHQQQ